MMPTAAPEGAALDIRPIDLDSASLESCAQLLQLAFPEASHITADSLHCEYAQNPDGRAFGWNAFDGERLVSHCVVQPLRARLFEEEVRGVLWLNGATHPDYQRRGSYFELAAHTHADARERGYAFGIGVANKLSTRGFVTQLRFQQVRPLDVQVGVGQLQRHASAPAIDLERHWSDEALAWRRARPPNPRGISSGGLSVWIGLDPAVDWERSLYAPLPSQLRPSALNLIFCDLTGGGRELDAGRVRWHARDFGDL